MKQYILCLLLLILLSCKKEEAKEVPPSTDKKLQTNIKTNEDDPEKPDTLKITYEQHKNLFDI